MQSMQSRRKSASFIPEKPADYENFVKKLEWQFGHAHTASPEAINNSLLPSITTSGVKRLSDALIADSAPKKPTVALPIKPQSFYAKNPETHTHEKQVPWDARARSWGHANGTHPPHEPGVTSMESVGIAPRAEFKLQRQAFEFLAQQKEPWSQHLRVFARELSGDGKRCFFVTTPSQLWVADVESAKPASCHLYEIIREGMPCHLYFDLEFVPDLNPGVCGNSLVDLLVELVAEELHGTFGIRMPLRPSPNQQQQEQQQQQQELREKCGLWQHPEQHAQQPEQPGPAGDNRGQQRQQQVQARGSEHARIEVKASTVSGSSATSLGDSCAGAGGSKGSPCGDFGAASGCGGDINRGSASDSSVDISDGSCPWVWELCSTTPAKFSRHLIIRIPHCAFKDNFHVNAFVRRLFDRIAADPARFKAFFVRRSTDPDDSPTLFIDPAVYTRNRAFRLYLSSKAGKSAVLHATCRYAVASLLRRRGSALQTGGPAGVVHHAAIPVQSSNYYSAPSRKNQVAASTAADLAKGASVQIANIPASAAVQPPDSTMCGGRASFLLAPSVEKEIARDIFLSSLVTDVGRVDRVLTMYGVGCGSSDGVASLAGFHAAADLMNGGPSRAMNCLGIPRLPKPAGGHGCTTAAAAGCQGPWLAGGAGTHPRRSAAAGSFQYGASPFPYIDEFIESVCCEGGVQGRVRCWQYLPDSATLLLSMRDNRWCANIGRAHRSNGIYFTVDLRGGTWHQRCYDPECRDFRSTCMPLPPHLWEDCRSRVCRQQLKENQEQQPQQQACLHGAQPTDKVQVSEQLQIPQERRQDQSPEQTLATAATRGNPCDEDEGPDFDLLCVQALESFEMMMASNAVI